MFGNNHSIRRIATGIALAGVAAALIVPAGFAASGPQAGMPDPWMLPYLKANQGQPAFATDTTNSALVARGGGTGMLPAGFTTDTLNSASVATGRLVTALPAGFQTDTLNSAQVAGGGVDASTLMARHFQHEDAISGDRSSNLSYHLPGGFRTDTVDSARMQPRIEEITVGGFDWSSFGIGIGSGVGLLLALGLIGARTVKVRRLASA